MDYDAAWKRLFRLPLMVEHLLRGFAAEVAGRLDLATLRELSASWAAPDAEQRVLRRVEYWREAVHYAQHANREGAAAYFR